MYQSITTAEFEQYLIKNSPYLIDLREPTDFLLAHIPNAHNIPMDELALAWEDLEPDKQYYLICYMGKRSSQASEFLTNKGFQAINILGGMDAWLGDVTTLLR
ncbi:rhodanese-like domain-containing protein [Listeria sp. PSOL-1]|uniref:rhodanese-like domain-containing protein n=1 Tax=Listeria sp. PSOL-1 TaxID=1844999 RepID=UPI0013D88E12|nr:rhodanese-like domain-containing protein [Listeria sp. PSOL-1]